MKLIKKLSTVGIILAGCILLSAPSHSSDSGRAADKLIIVKSIYKIDVPEIRAQRNGDVLSVQADFVNDSRIDKHVFYRFRWIDSDGNQVGDGESWKQLLLLGRGRETIKGVAQSPKANDFQIELNVQSKK